MRRHRITLLVLAMAVMIAASLTTMADSALVLTNSERGTVPNPSENKPNTDTLQGSGLKSQRKYYPPPNDRQLQMEFSSTKASNVLDGSGRLWVKTLKVKYYPVTGGDAQLTATAPECLYDNKNQKFADVGPLQIRTQDEKLFLEGTNFLLRLTNSSLSISNGVHSVFQIRPATNGVPAAFADITAHRGDFHMGTATNDGSAIYWGNVRAIYPKMNLAAEFLSADLPRSAAGQTNTISHAVAETNVVIDLAGNNGDQTRATSQKAVYRQSVTNGITNDLVELTENPRLELTNGWMTADTLCLNHTTGKMQGRGHVHFHYLDLADTNNPDAKPPAASDIACELFDYDLNTRRADFTDQVRVDDEKMKLSARYLTAVLPKSEPGKKQNFDHFIADTNVVIDFQEEQSQRQIHSTGQHAVYDFHATDTITNETLTLTGNPALQTVNPEEGWMTADTIIADRAQGRVSGIGNQHSVFKKQPGESAAMDTEVFSDQFDYQIATGVSIYQGNVREYDPEMNLTGSTLTIKIAKTGVGQTNSIEHAEAHGGVALDLINKSFAARDITNLPVLAGRLQSPAPSDGMAAFTISQLSDRARKLLAEYHGGTNAELQGALADDLNRIVRSGAVYDARRFGGVYLSPYTASRMSAQPLGVDLIELNRLLYLDAFRGEIAHSPDGDKVHAIGDHAVYSQTSASATNQVVELSGHPRLDRSDFWATADDTIIYNVTTGRAESKGHSYFHKRLEKPTTAGLTTTPAKGTN